VELETGKGRPFWFRAFGPVSSAGGTPRDCPFLRRFPRELSESFALHSDFTQMLIFEVQTFPFECGGVKGDFTKLNLPVTRFSREKQHRAAPPPSFHRTPDQNTAFSRSVRFLISFSAHESYVRPLISCPLAGLSEGANRRGPPPAGSLGFLNRAAFSSQGEVWRSPKLKGGLRQLVESFLNYQRLRR